MSQGPHQSDPPLDPDDDALLTQATRPMPPPKLHPDAPQPLPPQPQPAPFPQNPSQQPYATQAPPPQLYPPPSDPQQLETLNYVTPGAPAGGIWTYGGVLVMHKQAQLPPQCIKCCVASGLALRAHPLPRNSDLRDRRPCDSGAGNDLRQPLRKTSRSASNAPRYRLGNISCVAGIILRHRRNPLFVWKRGRFLDRNGNYGPHDFPRLRRLQFARSHAVQDGSSVRLAQRDLSAVFEPIPHDAATTLRQH